MQHPLAPETIALAHRCRERAHQDTVTYIDRLRELVGIDSGPDDAAGRDRVVARLFAWAEAAGLATSTLATAAGAIGRIRLRGRDPQGGIVLLGHHDTVFPRGTAAERPLAVKGTRVTGPGSADMKGGLLLALTVLECLARGGYPTVDIELWSLPDEEVRKHPSFPGIEQLAGKRAALVFECGRENGDFVAQRKVGALLRLIARGRAAHAGTEPERGRNALVALAEAIPRVAHLSGAREGLTVSPTVAAGGTLSNVIPVQAEVSVDVRARTPTDLDWALAEIAAIAVAGSVNGVRFERDLIGRWPGIEPTAKGDELAAMTQSLAAVFGLTINGSVSGGISDGSRTAAVGIPTIDGLGPVGGDDHSPDEYIDLSSVADRVGIVAGLVAALSGDER